MDEKEKIGASEHRRKRREKEREEKEIRSLVKCIMHSRFLRAPGRDSHARGGDIN